MSYFAIGAEGQPVQEFDTTWCRHCQAVLRLSNRTATSYGKAAEGALCTNKRCNGPICATCAEKARTEVHQAFKDRIDQALRTAAFAKAAGLGG